MRVSIIAAVAANGIIGADNGMPWHLAADFRYFKNLTMGHHLVMGRVTFDSVGSLPGRRTLVLTRGEAELPPGVSRVGSLEEALEVAERAGEEEIFIAGGAEIYRLALGVADRMYLTQLHAEFEGDTSFPSFSPANWAEVERSDLDADEKNPYPYSWLVLDRCRPGR